jgi:hypothetical protein
MTIQATADAMPDAAQRSRRWVVPAVFLLAILGALGWGALLPQEEPATMLGASGTVPGGHARLNGSMPYETFLAQDPREVPPELEGDLPQGMHRALVLLELTAVDGEGLVFDADDYAVDKLGGLRAPVAWTSRTEALLERGETLQVELVFELPDKALEMTLEGPGDVRLSMGTDHHSGAGGR